MQKLSHSSGPADEVTGSLRLSKLLSSSYPVKISYTFHANPPPLCRVQPSFLLRPLAWTREVKTRAGGPRVGSGLGGQLSVSLWERIALSPIRGNDDTKSDGVLRANGTSEAFLPSKPLDGGQV
ncbi:hypothetical protein EYF80_051292 [Liparis tanakae]|uniref:Uncharacterized protein n=1 Tax=Liparis tanakae TaxID=230148 RepID=A0A4Z2FCB2_9TELE|nr:hypothetical protein EYF80_051292 [Liparis tanakae]